ncbi:hypothetical protein [Halorussus pelagicus]|uniref:hypothetical protein n=1 Tax=Halorussus pelagicus TaxID=2505977 RepID=UPI0014097278|nr:hypothetical protein [Halorussus pelagicus]
MVATSLPADATGVSAVAAGPISAWSILVVVGWLVVVALVWALVFAYGRREKRESHH